MRIALMIAILIGSLAGCDLASGAPSFPAPSGASSSEGDSTPVASRPSPSALSILHLGEAYLVVASKYEHLVDQVDFRHLLKTAPDYRAYCTEMGAATADYIDGLAQIPFGPAQQTTVGTLIADAQIYDAWLGVCARGASLPAIKKIAGSMLEARQATDGAGLEVRRLLQLPIPTTAP